MTDNLKYSPFQRCGSYPFMNIAQDFGLPYGTLLRYSQVILGEGLNNPDVYILTDEDEMILMRELNSYRRLDLKKAIYDAVRNQRCGQ